MNDAVLLGLSLLMAVSFHLQYGQGGMVGFGHAVFAGAGAFAVAHAWQALAVPIEVLPLLGVLAGAVLAGVLGALVAGLPTTAFAMVTLATAELAWSAALAWPAVFGGDAGWGVNRDALPSWIGGMWASDPAQGVRGAWSALALAWVAVGLFAMVAWTRTPWGRWVVAARDNPLRAQALGQRVAWVRGRAMVVSGAGAGLAGALWALHFEIASVDALHPMRSATVLLFAVMAGGRHWGGAVLAGVLAWAVQTYLSRWTSGWLLYTGLLFALTLVAMPQGLWTWGVQRWSGFTFHRRPEPQAPSMPRCEWPSAAVTVEPAGVLLEFKDAGVRMGSTQILANIRWAVSSGERWAVVGPNGAGKSTLLRVLTGEWRLTSGQRKGTVSPGRGFQTSQLFDTLSVADHLRLACPPALAEDLLDAVGLTHRRDALAEALSYGERRLLDVVLAFANGAPLVVLDEPTSGLGQADTAQLVRLIDRLAQGRTLVLVEHDREVVQALATHRLVLNAGRVVAAGPMPQAGLSAEGQPDERAAQWLAPPEVSLPRGQHA